jgi:glycine dehydrogenase
MVIREYLKSKGEEKKKTVCLIPESAHGTNPASAVMAGFQVKTLKCHPADGHVDVDDVKMQLAKNKGRVGCVMITYPSTYGIFERQIRDVIDLVHKSGGLVYFDGANMNAQVGLARPGDLGADVCHLNMHKTFGIPHGGGGPPAAPICVAAHMKAFLPGHPVIKTGGTKAMGPVSGTPWACPSILPISWMYMKMLGGKGLTMASKMAILSANYVMKRLAGKYHIVFTGENGYCAHEFILDLREFKDKVGIEAEDVAKRLMDYGFHAPTMSFPVGNTLMIEPTESESLAEMDRICEALLKIREEIRAIEEGRMPRNNNPLKNSPHTMSDIASDKWDRPYSREEAVFPVPSLKQSKQWPTVNRIKNAYGDVNFCPYLKGLKG